MGLVEDAAGHWEKVETMLKKAADDALFDENGDPRTLTAEQWAGHGIKMAGLLVWLWGDGYDVLRNNAGAVVGAYQGDPKVYVKGLVPKDKEDAAAAAVQAAIDANQ